MRKSIHTDQGAPPKGPYSQAVVASGTMVYLASQGPIDPATGERIQGAFRQKAERVFQNVTTLLEAAGTDWSHVVRTVVFLNDMGNFAEMNDVYLQFAQAPYPARTTAQSNIGTAEIFVECTAVLPEA
ncbi:MAG: hypothetical protein KDE47_06400 [Caldilineaceae bacterium]|nr:hypothetical protein [Caldilineaceae bacterium]MCB9150947.1 RidA family protein [Caldilineaceae bacterium]